MRLRVNHEGRNRLEEKNTSFLGLALLEKKELPDGEAILELSQEKIQRRWSNRELSIEAIQAEFSRSKQLLVSICGGNNITEEHEGEDLLEKLVQEHQDRFQQERTIQIHADLSISATNPRIKIESRAWQIHRDAHGIHGKLVNPMKIEKDLSEWQCMGFRLVASEESLEKLSTVVMQAEDKTRNAIFSRADPEIRIEFDQSARHVVPFLANALKTTYKTGPKTSVLSFSSIESNCTIRVRPFAVPYVRFLLNSKKIDNHVGLDTVLPSVNVLQKRISLKEGVQLRQVQREAKNAWLKNKLGSLILGTGSGKTLAAISSIVSVQAHTLIAVPSLEIMDHWVKEFVRWTNYSADDIGIYNGERKIVKPITLITYHSGHRMFSEDDGNFSENEIHAGQFLKDWESIQDQFSLLVLDEGHQSVAAVFRNIMMTAKAPMRMNLTATAARTDGNETLAYIACGPIVHEASYLDLAKQKVVSPMEFVRSQTYLTELETEIVYLSAKLKGDLPAELARYKLLNNPKEIARIELEKHLIRRKIKELAPGLPLNMIEQESSYKLSMRKLFGFAQNKLVDLERIIRKHAGSKFIIFNEFRKGTRLIRKFLESRGIVAEILTGDPAEADRRPEVFRKFESGEISILITTTVLDKGINVPDCDVGIVVNGSSSKLQATQRAGRVGRYIPGKVAHFYELLAVVDTNLYKPEYSDCKRFSDFSLYDLTISKERDVYGPLMSEDMKLLVRRMRESSEKARRT